MKPKKNIKLDPEEQEILDAFERGELKRVPDFDEQVKMAEEAAANYAKRDKRINIRLSGTDLNLIRKIAAEEGLPYQTLIASVLHKFATGQLKRAA